MDKLSLVFRGHQHSTTMGLSNYIITSFIGLESELEWTGQDKENHMQIDSLSF